MAARFVLPVTASCICLLLMAGAQRLYEPSALSPAAARPIAATAPPPHPPAPPVPQKAVPAPPAPDPLIAGHDINVGKFYYDQRNYVGALARFDDAIYNDPSSAEAYCRAGDTQAKLKHTLPARNDWGRCLKLAGTGAWAKHARKQLAHTAPHS